mmetsp:Transcript_470/g.1524  ORF Transcript_470/g.1524 Transcript_470/m.1524 type:complete len:448 (-) Transcript_470:115-1458(-)
MEILFKAPPSRRASSRSIGSAGPSPTTVAHDVTASPRTQKAEAKKAEATMKKAAAEVAKEKAAADAEAKALADDRGALRTAKDVATFLSFCAVALVQQLLVLPLRMVRREKYLIRALEATSGHLMYLYCSVIESILGESSYGLETRAYDTYDAFLATKSKSRKRDIKRSRTKAEASLKDKGIESRQYAAGEWRFTIEHVAIIKTHCARHMATDGDMAGFPPWLTTPFAMLFEVLMILCFPMDLHELRKRDTGEVVAISTTCICGAVLFQPNYAIHDDIARDGFYQLFGQEAIRRAIDARCDYVNMMPTCGSAKAALGLGALPGDALDSCFSRPSSQDASSTKVEARVVEDAPKAAKKTSALRALRKSCAAATGVHGLFSNKKADAPAASEAAATSKKSTTAASVAAAPAARADASDDDDDAQDSDASLVRHSRRRSSLFVLNCPPPE